MIEIKDSKLCCGCGACYNVCPHHCISMQEDREGFIYPTVDLVNCTNCHLCEQVCPVLTEKSSVFKPRASYAAFSKDTCIRENSSSGGIFSLLSQRIIQQNGVVFGAIYNDDFDVVHTYTESIDGLSSFRSSKYSQSEVGDCYRQVKKFLVSDRPVLFSGTPCQISGLKHYLKKDYDNLFLISVICHGVPSPAVWRSFLKQVSSRGIITNINLRNKHTGWKRYSVRIDGRNHPLVDEPANKNEYMKAFLSDYILRPICYDCPFKGGKNCDLTLGDFWGLKNVLPSWDDDKGTSLVLAYTQKGYDLFNSIECEQTEVDYADGIKGNPSIEKSAKMPYKRKKVMKKATSSSFEDLILSIHHQQKAFYPKLRKKFIEFFIY